MGRLKKYNTSEEKRIAQNKWAMKYYKRHKKKISQKAKKKYAQRNKDLEKKMS